MKFLIQFTFAICLMHSFVPMSVAQSTSDSSQLILEKIIIFSRHGLRSPIEKDEGEMAKLSPYQWAKFDEPSGYLTAKGTILETYFGQYLGQWLQREKLLNAQNCASGEGIFAYANSLQRTIATGQALIAGAFAGCNVQLQHQAEIGSKDPLFEFTVRTNAPSFKAQAQSRLDLNALNKNLHGSYRLLSEVVDYTHAKPCLLVQQCDLGNETGKLSLETGKAVKLTGSIATGKKMVNALLLAHYANKPANEIANGNVDSLVKWQQLNEIKNEYYRSLYKNNAVLAANVALPMLQFIQQDLKSSHKITLLVGHDSNIAALLGALNVAPYQLPQQLENIPIGGKLLFEVWKDNRTNLRKFQLEYVYQTDEQIVNTVPLSQQHPPQKVRLLLPNCATDEQGLCDYSQFEQHLIQTIQNGEMINQY